MAKQLNAYVRHQVRIDSPDSSGVTRRQHLEKFKETLRKRGKTEEELDKQFVELVPPEVPHCADYLLLIYYELASCRQFSAMGNPLPISYMELKAYSELTDENLDPFEVKVLRMMDSVAIDEWLQLKNKEQAEKK